MLEHFSDEQLLDLGMTAAFFFGWQRFIEAFKIVPDRWAEGDPDPWRTPSGPTQGAPSGRGPDEPTEVTR
jgi:hypothetical protein